MQRVFISYSRQNLTFAERLANDLRDAGLDVWIDFREIKGGEEWREAIFAGIDQSEIVVVCLSPPAVESKWVRREILMADSQHKFIIPIMVEDAFDLMEKHDETDQLQNKQIITFTDRYESGLSELLDSLPGRIRHTEKPLPDDADIDPAKILNPFKGLEAFQQTDAAIFFGRDDLTTKLLDKLREGRRFIAVVGASGSGKSSLVRAGLIPRLRNGDLNGSADWPIAIFTPGARPTEALGKRLMPILGENLLPTMMTALERGPDSLHLLTEGLLVDAPDTARLTLVVDQFEEVFTRASQNAAAAFLDLLHTAATIDEGRTLVLLTMRADFFDRLSAYPDLAALFEQQNMVIVTDMTPDNLRHSIEDPAATVGLLYDHGLPDRILEDVRQQPGSLPLLQYALKALYERRDGRRLTFDAYEEIGGVQQALARHAEGVYQSMNTGQQELARRVLLRLVEVGEGSEPTRRQVDRAVLSFRGVSDEAVQDVIDRLTAPDCRLLIASRAITAEDPDAEAVTWIEVSHEALIREWERFKDWIAESEEELRHGGELLKAAQDWTRYGLDDGYLWTGSRLERGLTWLRTADATNLQREFLETSRRVEAERLEKQRERERYLMQARFGLVLAIALVAMLGLMFITFQNQSQLEARQTAEAQAVAAQSTGSFAETQAAEANEARATAEYNEGQAQSLLWANAAQDAMGENDYDLALPLALGAARVEDPPLIARDTLADAAYQSGWIRRVGQYHTSTVYSVAYSPDGTTALSGSGDGTLMLWDVASGEAIRTFSGHTDDVLSVVYSPDGTTALSGSRDRTLIVWDMASGAALRTLRGHTAEVLSVVYSPDGTTALSGSMDSTLILWDVASGEAIRTFSGHTDGVYGVAFSPDGTTALSGSSDSTLMLWDVATGQAIRTLRGHTDDVYSVAYSPDGMTALSGSRDSTLMLWDVASGEAIRTFSGHTANVYSVAFSPDGTTALSGSRDSTLKLWDVASGDVIRTFSSHKAEVYSVAYSPDGMTALSGSRDSTLKLWDVATGQAIRTLSSHTVLVLSVAYSPDGTTALSGSRDSTLILWDVASGGAIQTFSGHMDGVYGVAYSPDGMTALGGSADNTLMMWDVVSGEAIRTLRGHTDDVYSVAFSPDGMTALSGSADGTLIVWDVVSREALHTLSGHTAPVWSVAYSPDGMTALSGSSDSTLILWDVARGEALHTLSSYPSPVSSVAYSPDGATALSGSWDSTLMLWDVASGEVIRTLRGHTAEVLSVAYSPDGLTVLSGSSDNTLMLWDVATGQAIRTLRGHTAEVLSVAYSPDGLTVLSGSSDSTLILWDVATGQAIRTFSGHTDGVYSVTFSPDGQTALSGSIDDTLILWRIQTVGELTDWIYQNREVRELTCQERALYNFEPGCDENGIYPTRTPYMTWTPSPTPNWTPTSVPPTRTPTPTLPPN